MLIAVLPDHHVSKMHQDYVMGFYSEDAGKVFVDRLVHPRS